MADQFDEAEETTQMFLDNALKEQSDKMLDMEMVDGAWECCDCGRPLSMITKARLNDPEILCGECHDYAKKFRQVGKMRSTYE